MFGLRLDMLKRCAKMSGWRAEMSKRHASESISVKSTKEGEKPHIISKKGEKR